LWGGAEGLRLTIGESWFIISAEDWLSSGDLTVRVREVGGSNPLAQGGGHDLQVSLVRFGQEDDVVDALGDLEPRRDLDHRLPLGLAGKIVTGLAGPGRALAQMISSPLAVGVGDRHDLFLWTPASQPAGLLGVTTSLKSTLSFAETQVHSLSGLAPSVCGNPSKFLDF
jgi:hypothetical protein